MKLKIFFLALIGPFIYINGMAAQMPISKIATVNKLKLNGSHSFKGCNSEFSFKENSRTFLYNGVSMPLGFPTSRRSGSIAVHTIDYKTHIRPFLPSGKPKYKKLKVIVVDAGHGGEDQGTSSVIKGLKEKSLAMDVTLKVARILSEKGYEVLLTRQNDKKIALSDRTKISNAAQADLFICIHFNSAPTAAANGIETFVLTPPNQSSTYQKSKIENYTEEFAGNKFDTLNIVLGYHLQSHLLKSTAAKDRGVKHSNFQVLKGLNCPGALIECGFLSNLSESTKIASAEYREKIARGICNGIIAFDLAVQ